MSKADQQNQKQEGVIQYELTFQLDRTAPYSCLPQLNYWRCLLFRLGMIGQDDARYDGLGYGNLSHRIAPCQPSFLISGTQTGCLPLLCQQHYVLVEQADVMKNALSARGPVKPSSEALTHAALYTADDRVQSVIHVHSPLIWTFAEGLGLMVTDANVAYGTPEMAQAVIECVRQNDGQRGVIVMKGHQDGIISYAKTVDQAGQLLLDTLMAARELLK